MRSYKGSVVFFSLLLGLFLGMQNSAAAIDCPPGTTPQTQPASLTVIQAKMENSLEPYFWGAGIAGTPDGGAVATDTLQGRVVKIDPKYGAPMGKEYVLAGGGSSDQDGILATEAQIHYPTAVAVRMNGRVLVVARNSPYGKNIVREIYPIEDKNYISTIAGGGSHSRANSPIDARQADFGEIQSIVSIDEFSFLIVSNNTTASVWRVTWSDGSHWLAQKIVGDGQSGVVLRWASGIDVTRTADGKYQDLLLGGVPYNGPRAILKFTGDWISGKGHMSLASQGLSDTIHGLVAQPDGSIVYSTYDRIKQVRNAQMPPEILAGGGSIVPPNETRYADPLTTKLQEVLNLAHVGKPTGTPATFLIADFAGRYYIFTPQSEYCNGP